MFESKRGIEPSVLKEINELHDQLDDQLAPYVGEFTKKEMEENEKALAALGAEFNICFDALLEVEGGSMPTKFEYYKEGKKMTVFLDEEKFFEGAKKIEPIYREHLQTILSSEMDEFEKENPKASSSERNEYFSILAVNFMTRLEIFSNLDKPKNIGVGLLKTFDQCRSELEKNGFGVGNYTRENLLNTAYFAEELAKQKPEEVNTVRLTVNDLFRDGQNHNFDEIRAKAHQLLGLEVCPPEVGPAYRLAYPAGEKPGEQPMGEALLIAMDPILDPDSFPNVFNVVRNGEEAWLDNCWVDTMNMWEPDQEFVFRLPVSPVSASKT